jgi:hypothetical protein
VSLSETMPLATPFFPAPPPIISAAPCGQQLCSTRLSSTLLSSAPGRLPPPWPLPPPPPPPAVTTHRSSLQGVGTPGLDTPHRGPELSRSDRRTVGRRTPKPRGGQCARVPCSLLKVSASWGCSHTGALETGGGGSVPSQASHPRSQAPRWALLQVHLRQVASGEGGTFEFTGLPRSGGLTG